MNISLSSKNYTGILIPVIAFTFYAIASGYLMSVLPLLLKEFNLDESLVNWLASAYFIGLLAGTIYSEKVLLCLGHKKSFSLFLILLTLSVTLFPLWPNDKIWLLTRFMEGICIGGIFVFIESWLLFGDASARTKRLSLYMSSLYAATAIGQLGLSINFDNIIFPFLGVIGIFLLATIIILIGHSEQPKLDHESPVKLTDLNMMSHSALIGCTVSGVVLGVIYGLMPATLVERNIPSNDVGNLMALVILGAMVAQPMISLLLRMFGKTLLLALCCFLGASSIVLYTMSSSLLGMSISLFVLGMTAFSIYPISLNLASCELPENRITTGTKIMLLSYSIGNIIGPIGVEWLSAYHNSAMLFLFCVLVSTCIYMLVSSIKTKRKPLWAMPK